jgi:hypothetical protein
MRISHIGRYVEVKHDGLTFYGEERNGVLFTYTGTMQIPECATIIEPTQIKQVHKLPFSQREPDTVFEYWQEVHYGNFLEEKPNAETHDDLKQWHIY